MKEAENNGGNVEYYLYGGWRIIGVISVMLSCVWRNIYQWRKYHGIINNGGISIM